METTNNIINSALLASTGAEVFLSIRLKRILSQYSKIGRDINDKEIETARKKEDNFSNVIKWVSSVIDREDAPRYGEDYLKRYNYVDSEEKSPKLEKKIN